MEVFSSSKLKKNKIDLFYIVVFIVLTLWAIVILYPFYNAILISLVPQIDYTKNPFMLFPKRISLSSYELLFHGKRLLVGYKTTMFILLLGIPLNMLLTTCTAYPLSRKIFPGKSVLFPLIIFTMFFSGGIIPLYLVIKGIGLTNNIWSIVLVSGINTFYLILVKNYFESIPESIEESAKIDGANDISIFFNIILPLSKPILATVFLFYMVDRWNEWFYSMIFLRSRNWMPLQVILRNIIFESTVDDLAGSGTSLRQEVFSEGIKMAAITLTMTPIMIIYPFLQKHFVKGIMLGSVKS